MATIPSHKKQLPTGDIVTIRSASVDDAPGCLSLHQAVVGEGRLTLATQEEFERTEDAERFSIDEAMKSAGSVHVVAEIEDAIVGNLRANCGSTHADAHFCDLSNVWVGRDWRGKGVGTLLMEALIEWAQASDTIEKLGLFVFSTSTAARHLYEKHGFEVEGRGVRDMKFGPGDYADTIIMGRFV